jgi:alcohol dehydrogenase
VFSAPGQPIEVREIPIPALKGSEVLVAVVACTLCGSDRHSIEGRRAVPVPTILGHEILGRVVEFGPEASRIDAAGRPLKLGDRIAWGIVASCGDCFFCIRDLPQKCERQLKYGHEPLRPGGELTGGLAGHCVLAAGTATFAVPDGLSDEAACPAGCAGATIGAAIEAAGPLQGRRVLVMGSGMLGMTATAWARSLGADRVIACDTSADRLQLAARFGATDLAGPAELAERTLGLTEGRGVDAAIELTGAPEAVEALIPLVRTGGTAVLVGSVFPSRPVPLLPEQVVRRCLTIKGVHNYAPRHLRAALAFLDANPGYPFGSLVDGWAPLAAIEAALARPLAPGKLRLGIRPGG